MTKEVELRRYTSFAQSEDVQSTKVDYPEMLKQQCAAMMEQHNQQLMQVERKYEAIIQNLLKRDPDPAELSSSCPNDTKVVPIVNALGIDNQGFVSKNDRSNECSGASFSANNFSSGKIYCANNCLL